MQTTTISIYQLFQMEHRCLVPLFQRPYVWGREGQWEPLWEDITFKAQDILAQDILAHKGKRNYQPRKHFMGAVVLSHVQSFGLEVAASEVIDGQQRLTTLQLLLIALRDYAKANGYTAADQLLGQVTFNSTAAPSAIHHRYKVWPTNADRPAFEDIWTAGTPAALEQKYPLKRIKYTQRYEQRPPLIEAYLYFYEAVRNYIEGTTDDSDDTLAPQDARHANDRLDALLIAITRHLELVKIDLEDRDDPQVIFETLNARGVPLLPSDLVRNFLFMEAARNDADVEGLYRRYWQPYDETDAAFWKREVRQGRLTRPMMDLFLFHFVSCGKEQVVAVNHIYQTFKDWWDDEQREVETELQSLQRYSDTFRQFYSASDGSRLDVFGRRLRVMDIGTIYPLLLFLLVEKADEIATERDGILADLESFLVRRVVCGLTNKAYNRLFLDMLSKLRHGGTVNRSQLRRQLLSSTSDSERWPSDEEFKRAWLDRPVYRELPASRVTMMLEALEWQQYGTKQERAPFSHSNYSIEHLLPQTPTENDWPLSVAQDADEQTRATALAYRERLKHTFGNLTLLTQALNSEISNGPFTEKLEAIERESLLILNKYFTRHQVRDWDEQRIIERGERLFAIALEIWPRPSDAS